MYRDVVTGFTGVATSKTEYLNACVRVGLTHRELRDGKPLDTQVFDEHQLELVTPDVVPVVVERVRAAERTGGPGEPVPPAKIDAR